MPNNQKILIANPAVLIASKQLPWHDAEPRVQDVEDVRLLQKLTTPEDVQELIQELAR